MDNEVVGAESWVLSGIGFGLVVSPTIDADNSHNYRKCEEYIRDWSERALAQLTAEEAASDGNPRALKELLFFLHVPRTGGRTFNFCLLRHLYDKKQLCERSYDVLQFNASEHCRLLVTHDDYSVLAQLPRHLTSIVTNMRHPLDRVFSTYEFSVEIAARFLRQLPSTSSLLRRQSVRASSRVGQSTLDIWPWKYLVPWMREDLFRHRNTRDSSNPQALLNLSNPYDVPLLAMPLAEFIHQSIASELVHNGGTFQVARITNNSYLKEAGDLRKCASKYLTLGRHVLDIAKRRLEKMVLAGLTEQQKETATYLANLVREQDDGRMEVPSYLQGPSFRSSKSLLNKIKDPKSSSTWSFGHEEFTQLDLRHNITLFPKASASQLVATYSRCASKLRGTQISRRQNSLKYIESLKFSNEFRRRVPESVRVEILQLNTLDLELYEHTERLFSIKRQSLHKSSEPQEKHVMETYKTPPVLGEEVEEGFEDSPIQEVAFLMVMSYVIMVLLATMGLSMFIRKYRRLKKQQLRMQQTLYKEI